MKEDRKITKIEESVAQALIDLEKNADLKTDIKDIYIEKVREIEIPSKNK